MDVEVLGRVGRRYFRRRERVLHDPSPVEVEEFLTELCTPYEDPRWWTNANVGDANGPDGVTLVVAPVSGYIALSWTGTAERSLNPHPFADAPLLPDSGDDDPLIDWPRSAFLHPANAGRRSPNTL